MCSGSAVRGNITRGSGNSGNNPCCMVLLWLKHTRGRPARVEISGKVVLITGASEGVGAACAEAFRRRGARLSLAARSASRLEEVGRGEALVTPGDLTEADVRRRVVERTLERFGRVDILINNAGVGCMSLPRRRLSKQCGGCSS